MPTTPSKAALRIRNTALVLLIVMPVAALGARFGAWPYTIGLLLCAAAMVGSLIIQIINAIWLLRKPAAGTKTALRWASLFALPPLVIIAALMRDSGSRAGIHNISTDTVNPPEFVAAIIERGSESNPLEYTPEVAVIQRKFFPEVKTINSDKSPQQAFVQAITTAKQMGWEVYAQDIEQGRIEALESTFWFGFKDDIVIRIRATESGSDIDLRSVSRVGRGDMGANAARIAKFSELVTQ